MATMVELEKGSDRARESSATRQSLLGPYAQGQPDDCASTNLLVPRTDLRPAPLSFAQERLWFLDQINASDASSNISRGVRINGDLKKELLQRSLQEIVNRHELLRTTFAQNQLYAGSDGQPVQLVAENRNVDISLIDLSGEPPDQREIKAQESARAEAQRLFDLTLGPLLRATLLKLGEHEHVLVLSLHRIVCDDWSADILIEELWASYNSFARGESWPAAPLQIQYADYAAWQRQLLDGENLKPSLDYWRANLKDAPAVIELPTDRSKPPVQTWHGASVQLVLEKELVERLRAIGAGENATLAAVLLASLNVLMTRHTRQQDLVVGAAISNRDTVAVKQLIGPLSNLLSIRTDLSSNPTFRELLAHVSSATHEAQRHRSLPFEKLIEELQVERSLSHAPVFQVTFKLEDARSYAGDVGDLRIEEFDFDDGITQFDLTVDIRDSSDQLDCRFGYNTDLFDRATIERMGGHFKVLLAGIVSNPEQGIADLPLLPESELQQILAEWNYCGREYKTADCIHDLFEAQVERTPNATAVVFGDDRVSYSELNRRANQLAHHLRALGIGPEERVGICLGRSVETVVALLATLKAGGAYVPLDPAYPQDRLAFMLQDSRVPVLITQKSLLAGLPDHRARVIQIDADWQKIAVESEANPSSSAVPENLAYVIYTSGSTGQPKGVAIEHVSTVAFLQWALASFSSEDLAAVLASTSICFDLSVFELFAPLCSGGIVVLVENALQLPDLRSEEVTLVNTVPSAMAELVRLRGIPPTVKIINLAGEPLAGSLVQRVYDQESVQEVLNLYGPSEDTTYSTFARLARGVTAEPPIGRPIANTAVYLLDSRLQPVPVGVGGELYLGGAGLARGYLNRSSLTAEKFVPNPFSQTPGARLYRTGDLARYRRDGNIEFLGRLDHQVKLRGFRIELGEIEIVLGQHPQVEQAVVVAREDQPGDKRLVAYIVPGVTGAPKASEVRKFLQLSLPEYMVPSAFVMLDSLPLTPNNKVDRRALPPPDEARPNLQQAYVAPRDRLEGQLATLWKNVLQLKSIGVRDDFFELGGHSLLAARLFAQIENRLGKHLPLAALFQAPTIEQLANVLRGTETDQTWSSLVAIQPEGSKPPLFCVHAAGANVLIYRPLSRHLGNDQPVFALQAQGLDGQARPLTRVEDMAALYIGEMRAFQPDGPYFLLGASFGGLVVYEMAQQLLAQGQQVALLAMLNTNCPVSTLAKRMRCHLGHLRQYGVPFYAREIWRTLKRRLTRQTAERDNADGGKHTALDLEIQKLLEKRPDVDESLVRTVSAIMDAERDYAPAQKTYPGKITFFWARDAETDYEDNRLAWRRVAQGGFEIHEIPGSHTTMREEPNVGVLVEKLRLYLNGR
ncbi:MAG: amino acid adenylation domain-containing protein [bacterium]